ncbi:hypothetical protein QOT17_019645 [Balamuthia mandrillaris]
MDDEGGESFSWDEELALMLQAEEEEANNSLAWEQQQQLAGREEEEAAEEEAKEGQANKEVRVRFDPRKTFGKVLRESIPSLVGPRFRVTRMEYIASPQLSACFRTTLERMVNKYGSDKAGPMLCFHGTNMRNIDSILTNGLLVPGSNTKQGAAVSVAHGSSWGLGIYLAGDPLLAMNYVTGDSDGERAVLACCALLGRSFVCDAPRKYPQQGGYDSHVNPEGKELVVFSGGQVLPCWLVYFEPTTSSKQQIEEEEKAYKKKNMLIE